MINIKSSLATLQHVRQKTIHIHRLTEKYFTTNQIATDKRGFLGHLIVLSYSTVTQSETKLEMDRK